MSTELATTLYWQDHAGSLAILDQTLLPHQIVYITCRSVREVGEAIRTMKVRGAPAIGVSAAFGMVLAAQEHQNLTGRADFLEAFEADAKELGLARPTAVNLAWGIARMKSSVLQALEQGVNQAELPAVMLAAAKEIQAEDVANNRQMGQFGAALIPEGANILTHCNAGALATAGYGTQLGVIRAAWEKARKYMFISTRPGHFSKGRV